MENADVPTEQVDVVVVGYGPTGMVLAALLGQAGRSVIVLERFPTLFNLPRAAAFDGETMRTFQKLGVAEKMLPGCNIQTGYVWTNGEGEVLLDIQYDTPGPSGWPAQYMMYQPHLERVLDDLVRSLPTVTVLHGASVIEIGETDDAVVSTAQRSDGSTVRVSSRYLVGADGGNGFVRTHLNAQWDDYGFRENWLVCDFALERDVADLPTFRQVCNPHEPIAIVNIGPGHHRFSFRLDEDADRAEVTKAENVWPRVREFLSAKDARLNRTANYTFQSLIADTWRDGRILLAGDAAHQMPPFLAQGMVSGIRDARNIAWKLGMTLDGHVDVLDSYQREREPHVRFITEKAIELGRVQTERDLARAAERDARMLAARRANKEPDKLVYPGLTDGLVANDGRLLPQGLVSTHARTGLFDDIAGTGWLIVAQNPDALSASSDEHLDGFSKLGGGRAVFGIASRFQPGDYSDTAGVYARYFAETGAIAAVVRPDSYVYGLARDPQELAALIERVLATFGVRSLEGMSRL